MPILNMSLNKNDILYKFCYFFYLSSNNTFVIGIALNTVRNLKFIIMKKLILLIVIVSSLSTAFAQTREEVISFLTSRTMPFNKNAKVIQVNNLDSVMKSCAKKNISYCHDTFILYGPTLTEYSVVLGGHSRTIIRDKRVPFVVYKTYHNVVNNIIIEVVSGSDSF